ncbi:LA_2272 family surface repeat-containing protein [Geobacter sp. SVR]|uniref:LA_2272 family surface repeat-containing protein n=1 Tax=Geobacter sp. SVR TaxID=2495594 RepID=UPI00143EF5F5|nr:hypothetical protein [Geobacter sp. SVR]BCS52797.1 hypothetical protein GSVR_11050 [Geobacter sp. SVR]GCF86663.1 hypothetical protein GSbR_32630 [Geobacter sp. SVR]
MKRFETLILVMCLSLCAFSAYAAEQTPLQLSLVNPVQLFQEETTVKGLRVNLIYGVNKEVQGVDYGLINRTTGTTQGAQLGVFPFGGVNLTENLYGVQFGGVFGGVNIAGEEVKGVQFSGIFGGVNTAGNVSGAQLAGIIGGINRAKDVTGVQIAGTYLGINLANNVTGVQVGTVYNQAATVEGLQLGLVNVCDKMRGIQIGLVNVIKDGPLPFFPVVNGSF